jgi:hypothetical protein
MIVLSPHVDDGVFSARATISRASRSGPRVSVLTLFVPHRIVWPMARYEMFSRDVLAFLDSA